MRNKGNKQSPLCSMVIVFVQFIIDPILIADPRGFNLGAHDLIVLMSAILGVNIIPPIAYSTIADMFLIIWICSCRRFI